MEEKSSKHRPQEQKNRESKESNSAMTKVLVVVSPLLNLLKVGQGFNSLKIVALCFGAILLVNSYESQHKITSRQADSAVNNLAFLSGAAVVLEQYIALAGARQRQKKNVK